MEKFLNCELFSRYYAFTNITDSGFADDVVKAEEKEETDILLADHHNTITKSAKMEIGPEKTKVMTNKDRSRDAGSGEFHVPAWDQSSLTKDPNLRFFPGIPTYWPQRTALNCPKTIIERQDL